MLLDWLGAMWWLPPLVILLNLGLHKQFKKPIRWKQFTHLTTIDSGNKILITPFFKPFSVAGSNRIFIVKNSEFPYQKPEVT